MSQDDSPVLPGWKPSSLAWCTQHTQANKFTSPASALATSPFHTNTSATLGPLSPRGHPHSPLHVYAPAAPYLCSLCCECPVPASSLLTHIPPPPSPGPANSHLVVKTHLLWEAFL
ncbi:hypothetical protein Cadr_000010848 [Camelus dromedarius]|uniref:Uncharacterized protein n=1 Tax=Camelus dromedarius TaxID=9838 RepID=A0A5N4DT12_CAMDR|nr:hypothetical protein Cadr_000010848 [Camelus dromedarius]